MDDYGFSMVILESNKYINIQFVFPLKILVKYWLISIIFII